MRAYGRGNSRRRCGDDAARAAGTAVREADQRAGLHCRYQLTPARLKLAKKDAIVMHPGPMIRGMEMTDEVADCTQSVVVDEVLNGVKMRMAILARALGKAK